VLLSHEAYRSNKVLTYFVATDWGREAMIKHRSPVDKVTRTGFPLDLKFRKNFLSQAEERARLGLRDQYTMLLTFGGEGLGNWAIVREMAERKLPVQVIVVCGWNTAMKQELLAWDAQRSKPSDSNFCLHVEGFVENMQDWLYVCDISTGKSGLNMVFESIYLKKPFLVLKAMANERYCAQWVVDQKYGWWPKNNKEAIEIIMEGLQSPICERWQTVRTKLEVQPTHFGIPELCETVVRMSREFHANTSL
jgi:processive 1,2-diacylglycerol beta-glucosyltransferase